MFKLSPFKPKNKRNDDNLKKPVFKKPASVINDGEGTKDVTKDKETGTSVTPKQPLSLLEQMNHDKKSEENEGEEKKTKTVLCGRIRFEGVEVKDAKPIELICEECEKVYSVIFCKACNQVYCMRCAGLCHQRNDDNVLHPHEFTDVWGNCDIRPVNYEDTSRVKIEYTYYLPEYNVQEEELSLQRNLSLPNSLVSR